MGLLGCIVWRYARDDQLSHEDQALEIILRVAAMVAMAVLGWPKAISTIPRPQRARGNPKAAGDGGYRQLSLSGVSGGRHAPIMPVGDRTLYFKSVQNLFRGLNNL